MDMTSRATTIPLGRVFGIPVRMSWSVVAVALVGSWLLATDVFPSIDDDLSLRSRLMLAGSGVIFFLGSILAHEFGHALAARRHGIQTSSIRLWIFGGVAALSSPARTPLAEFQIAIAGPGTNAALAGAFTGIAAFARQFGAPETITMVAGGLAVLNLLLTVTNLVPAAPLDGGKVLTSILWAKTGRPEWARLISAAKWARRRPASYLLRLLRVGRSGSGQRLLHRVDWRLHPSCSPGRRGQRIDPKQSGQNIGR